ncbi:MAG: hemerythrin [Rhodocyclales bacterium GT-UBC]|nr:MAG: hemerythrin [Rhodocyclales bacterium GT-UBC]
MKDDSRQFLPTALHIGIAEIDAQHASLFRHLAQLKALLIDDPALPVSHIEALLDELRVHFATEQHFAESRGFDFSHHAERHREMLAAVTKALGDVLNGQSDIFGVLRYVEYWFERHIAQEDRMLAQPG